VADGPAGEQRLAAYYSGAADPATLRSALEATLPGFMIPAAFVPLCEIPRTLNGKRDRKRLPLPVWGSPEVPAGDGDRVQMTELEVSIGRIWREILGVERLGRHDDFLALGGHSLLATRIVARVRQETGRTFTVSNLFAHPTVAACAASLARAPRSQQAGAVATHCDEAPLSAAQKQMWFLAQLAPDDASYNLPYAIRVTGAIEPERLRRALHEVMRRQSALRTRIIARGGRPAQQLVSEVGLDVPLGDLSSFSGRAWDELHKRALALAAAPFDLSVAPLLRARLFRLGHDDWGLAIVVHHAVFDEWSIGVLMRELAAAYDLREGEGVPEPAISYADFCAFQDGNDWSDALKYWRTELDGISSALTLPTDHPRPLRISTAGAVTTFVLDDPLSHAVASLAAREAVTEYMLLLAAFQVLLSKLSGQNDFVTLTAASGRDGPHTEDLIGCFMNMVPIRADLRAGESFRRLLTRVRRRVVDALDRQMVPLDRIVDELRTQRDPRYAPLGQVAFGVQNVPRSAVSCRGRKFDACELRPDCARLDLSVWADRRTGPFRFEWTYRTDLFEKATITSFHDRLTALFGRITESPEVAIESLRLRETRDAPALKVAKGKFPARLAPKKVRSGDLATIERGWLGAQVPSLVRAQMPGLNLADWARAHRGLIDEHLLSAGGVLLRGFRVDTHRLPGIRPSSLVGTDPLQRAVVATH